VAVPGILCGRCTRKLHWTLARHTKPCGGTRLRRMLLHGSPAVVFARFEGGEHMAREDRVLGSRRASGYLDLKCNMIQPSYRSEVWRLLTTSIFVEATETLEGLLEKFRFDINSLSPIGFSFFLVLWYLFCGMTHCSRAGLHLPYGVGQIDDLRFLLNFDLARPVYPSLQFNDVSLLPSVPSLQNTIVIFTVPRGIRESD
jgi:hypothetical protein